MPQLIVDFMSPLEDLALKRTNQAIRNVLNVLDFVDLNKEEKSRLRNIILDEINGLREELVLYIKNVKE